MLFELISINTCERLRKLIFLAYSCSITFTTTLAPRPRTTLTFSKLFVDGMSQYNTKINVTVQYSFLAQGRNSTKEIVNPD
jgi:hypothetical protein